MNEDQKSSKFKESLDFISYSIYSSFKDIHTNFRSFFIALVLPIFLRLIGQINNEAFFLPSEKLLLLQIEWQNIKCYPHISSYRLKKTAIVHSVWQLTFAQGNKNLNPIHFKDCKRKTKV